MEKVFYIGETVTYRIFDIWIDQLVYRKGKITGKDGNRWIIDNDLFLYSDWIYPLSNKQTFFNGNI